MTYEALVGCPANGYGDGQFDPNHAPGLLLMECLTGHDRVTWRGEDGEPCWVCDIPGRAVGFPIR